MFDIRDYCLETFKTAIYPKDNHKIDYLMLGLMSEVGELASIFKRIYRDVDLQEDNNNVSKIEKMIDLYDLDCVDPEVRQKVILEMGDIMWYMARLSVELNIQFEVILQKNIEKLEKRKINNTLHGSGDER